MKTLILIFLMIGSGFASSLRAKRELSQFGQMIRCLTGKSFWAYNDYGCWCGSGGSGTAVDATDRCCEAHDRCYERLRDSGTCTRSQLYNQAYTAYASSCGSRFAKVSCGDAWRSTCADRLCWCDMVAAYCFAWNVHSYNANFKNDDNFTC